MTAPTPAKQKTARAKLDSVFADAANTWVIHYSCESCYDRPNGASPRITSIGIVTGTVFTYYYSLTNGSRNS